ncbi:hypothetical protein FACS189431_1440 [Alphaproteobacteria bacterium]|nr:hypothetical protein FACS189431_1440 [Alphaproteobacteria bacterium]
MHTSTEIVTPVIYFTTRGNNFYDVRLTDKDGKRLFPISGYARRAFKNLGIKDVFPLPVSLKPYKKWQLMMALCRNDKLILRRLKKSCINALCFDEKAIFSVEVKSKRELLEFAAIMAEHRLGVVDFVKISVGGEESLYILFNRLLYQVEVEAAASSSVKRIPAI